MNLVKKAILYAAVPLMMGSCSIYLRKMGLEDRDREREREYESALILKVRDRNDIEHLTDLEFMNYWNIKFKNSVYSSHLSYDSDGDGIINADDPWKYTYGPFVDSNRNGIVDMFDWQIAGFGNSYIDNYPFSINKRWIGLDLNPFWKTEYFNRHEKYFNTNKKYRHHEKKYIRPHTVRDNKKRATYNTTTRDNTNRRSSGAIIRNTTTKRYKEPAIKSTPVRTTRTKRSSGAIIRNAPTRTAPIKSSQRKKSVPAVRQSTRSSQTRTSPTKRSSTAQRKNTSARRSKQ